MDTNDRMRTNILSQKKPETQKTLLLYELDEAETEVKIAQYGVMLKAKFPKHRAWRVQTHRERCQRACAARIEEVSPTNGDFALRGDRSSFV